MHRDLSLPLSEESLSPPVVLAAGKHLGRQLLRNRWVLAYVVLGALSGLLAGLTGFIYALGNYLLLLPLYTLVIYLWTRGQPTLLDAANADKAERRLKLRRDLALVALAFALNVGNAAWFWAGGPPRSLLSTLAEALRAAGWDRELAGTAANGLSNTAFALLPALILVFVVFRLRPSAVAFVPRRLEVGLGLIVLVVVIAGLVALGAGRSTSLWRGLNLVPLAFAVYAAQIFVNGLPEEFVYRGAIMGGCLRIFGSLQGALLASSILFVASHIPSYLAMMSGPPLWVLAPITPGPQPTGLIWGYLCYRTRSIWPGVLWHASSTILGITFF